MSTKQSTIDYLLDQLSVLDSARARKMFGEYALYCQEKVVALLCDDELFVKITPEGKKFVGKKYEEGHPFPGAKAYMYVSGDMQEDQKFLTHLILLTAKSLPVPKSKKSRKQ